MERSQEEKDKILRYSLNLAMLKTLYKKKLIDDHEYDLILKRIRKDYGMASELTAGWETDNSGNPHPWLRGESRIHYKQSGKEDLF